MMDASPAASHARKSPLAISDSRKGPEAALHVTRRSPVGKEMAGLPPGHHCDFANCEAPASTKWSGPMKLPSPNTGRTVLPSAVTNEEIATEFCAEIIDLSAKQAARIAHRTPAAAKKWKSGQNAPDAASLINAACGHDRVRAWLLWKIAGDWSRVMAPDVLTELAAVLLRAADAGDGAARRILAELHRG